MSRENTTIAERLRKPELMHRILAFNQTILDIEREESLSYYNIVELSQGLRSGKYNHL